jgi:hypothetical protein
MLVASVLSLRRPPVVNHPPLKALELESSGQARSADVEPARACKKSLGAHTDGQGVVLRASPTDWIGRHWGSSTAPL